MRNLHRRFLLESPDSRISYSLFCRMRPFWVVQPSIADRETCLCKLHENLGFLVEKLHFLRVIGSTDLEEMAESICCDSKSKDCMYNACPNCKDREFPIASERDLESTVYCTQWMTEAVLREKKNKEGVKEKVSLRMTVKKRMEMTLQNLLELFKKQLTHFKRHLFNIKSQFSFHRELKKSMTHQECLIMWIFRKIMFASILLRSKQCTLPQTSSRQHSTLECYMLVERRACLLCHNHLIKRERSCSHMDSHVTNTRPGQGVVP